MMKLSSTIMKIYGKGFLTGFGRLSDLYGSDLPAPSVDFNRQVSDQVGQCWEAVGDSLRYGISELDSSIKRSS